MAKDPLDALLGDEPIDVDEDLDDLLLADADGDGDDPLTSERVKELEEQLSNLEKEKQGFLSGIKDERRKRQELKGRLDQVTATIDGILETRQTAPAEPTPADTGVPGITVEFTEDGDAYIPNEKLEAMTSKYEEKIAQLEQELERTAATTQAETAAQQVMNSIVGENESYGPAFGRYQAARRWVENQVIDYQRTNNIQGTLTSGQALDHIFNDGLRQEFSSQFPDIELVDAVTAEDSQWHFRQMLEHTSSRMAPKEPDSRLTKVLNKPSGLGKSANAKAGEIPLSEKVSALSATDIMNLSDEQVEALQRAMSREEQTDGIEF
jgi:hypothetical protein